MIRYHTEQGDGAYGVGRSTSLDENGKRKTKYILVQIDDSFGDDQARACLTCQEAHHLIQLLEAEIKNMKESQDVR